MLPSTRNTVANINIQDSTNINLQDSTNINLQDSTSNLVIKQPLEKLDAKYYPLASAPTPPTLKKFCYDLNGVPTYFKELDISEQQPSIKLPSSEKQTRLYSNSSASSEKNQRKRSTVQMSNSEQSSSQKSGLKHIIGSPNKTPTRLFIDSNIIDTEFETPHEQKTLPSPTLSPTVLNSPMSGVLGMLSNQFSNTSPCLPLSAQNLEEDFTSLKKSFPNFGDTEIETTGESDDLKALPGIISTFDGLPHQLKSYLLLQLLRRCPLPTLQFISCLILPTLRRDFLGLLPVELSTHVLQYLDLRSLGRCCRVSKVWKRVIDGPSAETAVWKHRLSLESWLDQKEVTAEIKNYSILMNEQQLSSKDGRLSISIDDGLDSDEEFSLSHQNKVRKGKAVQQQLSRTSPEMSLFETHQTNPPNLYKNLYRRHHKIRLNWFKGKYRHITFPGHAFSVVTCLQFDSDKIVSGSDDHTIHIYDTSTGSLRKKLEGHEGGVWALQYWNDVLVSGSTDRSVRVWDMESGKCIQTFQGHTSTVRCLMIITPVMNEETKKMEPDFPLIVTGSRDSTLRVWKLPSINDTAGDFNPKAASPESSPLPDSYFMHTLSGHSSSVRAIAGHGNILISGSYDHTVRLWDLTAGTCTFNFQGHTEKVYSVGYSHELKRAASGSMDATVRVWCTRTGNSLFVLKEGHSSLVGLLEFSSTYLVSAAADATLRVWSPLTGKCLATLTGHTAAITCFHHDPKLNKIVSGSEGGVKVWELSSDGYKSEIVPPSTNGGPGFAFTQGPNGREPVHGRFMGDVVRQVQGVWRTRMDEKRLVCGVQREGGRTWFEVLDFSDGVDDLIQSDIPVVEEKANDDESSIGDDSDED